MSPVSKISINLFGTFGPSKPYFHISPLPAFGLPAPPHFRADSSPPILPSCHLIYAQLALPYMGVKNMLHTHILFSHFEVIWYMPNLHCDTWVCTHILLNKTYLVDTSDVCPNYTIHTISCMHNTNTKTFWNHAYFFKHFELIPDHSPSPCIFCSSCAL